MTDPYQQPAAPDASQQYTLGNLMPTPSGPPTPAPTGMPATTLAAWITLGAGLAMILGSFLPWASITAPIVGTYTVSGTDGTDGWVTAGAGVFVAVFAALWLRGKLPQSGATLAGVVAALGGLGVAGLSAWKVVDLQSKVADMKADMAEDGDEFGIAAAMADAVQARIGAGLWLLIGAGLAAAVCAGFLLLARRWRR